MSFQQLIIRWLTAQVLQKAKKEILKVPETIADTDTSADTLKNPVISEQLCCEDSPDKPESTEVDLGFVFAMPMEAAGVTDILKKVQTTQGNGRTFHTGIFHGFRTAIVESGVGQANAGRAAEVLIDVFKPKRILSAGYAGGLAKRLKQFDVCFPEILLRESDGKKFYASNSVPEIIDESTCLEKQNRKLILLTTDFVAGSPKQKSMLYHKTGAELVDMETFAVAEVCRKHQIPLLAVRIILDTAEEQIPKDVQRILKNVEKGSARLAGSVIGSIFSRPSSMLDLFSLKQRALRATDRLAKQIAAEL
ncbi:MAG: 5'-methylthioadenosine/S-adenosylhomocysteine nucleosidase, partial [Planctomycetaceae bacterium]|nr:5'-methylthioadenosine/S-adenosylhomocysteine nucleosidase [Planctomycetaceae bacterium]